MTGSVLRLNVSLKGGGCHSYHLSRFDIGASIAVKPASLHSMDLALGFGICWGDLGSQQFIFKVGGSPICYHYGEAGNLW